MSSYAMTSHLFFNLVWLWLFLGNRRGLDFAALPIGLIATGLHQPVFHPLFVAPFLLMLLIDRSWTRLAIYTVGYGLIGAFWMAWPVLMQSLVAGPESIVAGRGADFVTRLIDALKDNSGHLPLMAENLLRFALWQHLLTVPLMALGIVAGRRDRLVLALTLGLALPILIVAVILPWQGFGFGYRYLHGLLGNAVLLAGFGWRHLAGALPGIRAALVRASLASCLVLVPVQLWMMRQFYAPFAAASQKIADSRADYAVIELQNGFGFPSMIYNRPDLTNRPIELIAEFVPDHARLARRICRPGIKVAVAGNGFYRPVMALFDTPPWDKADARLPALRKPYEAAGCQIIVID
jgi:hypothetical protein